MIRLPVIEGTIDRRILLNYRIDPEYVERVLPPPFRPRLHRDQAIGGVCMIRFRALRPRRCPAAWGISSENAAHRVAARWAHRGDQQDGVFIPRRDTASAFNHWAGGKVFPGIFHRSTFDVDENAGRYRLAISQPGHDPHVSFEGVVTSEFTKQSCFSSLSEASDFFARGAVGYSPAKDGQHFQGMELRLLDWQIQPLAIHHSHVQLFDDGTTFPRGTTRVDSAMIMQRLRHEWHSIPDIDACQARI